MWRGAFEVVGGLPDQPTTYGAYGTGEKPLFKGSIPVTGWTLHSGNIWQANVPPKWTHGPNQVFIDGEYGDRELGLGNLTGDHDWWWDASTNTTYLYDSTGDPDNRNSPGIESSNGVNLITFGRDNNVEDMSLTTGTDPF